MNVIISAIEGLYIVYMFIFFKTTYSLEIGRWEGDPITSYFKKFNIDPTELFFHPTKVSTEPVSQICLFGKYSSILILILLILRNYSNKLKAYNSYLIIIIFLFCFMNYNALLYLVPFFLFEGYLTYNNLLKV